MQSKLWTESRILNLQKNLSGIWEDLAFEFVPVLESTNSLLKERVKSGGVNPPFLLLAGEQTSGRGRKNRGWYSPAGGGLYFSLLLEVDIPLERLYLLTVISALSAHGALAEFGYDPRLKWPNDILISGRKAAGILSEVINRPEDGKRVITGMGINTHMTSFPSHLKEKATSLQLEDGAPPSPDMLLQELLVKFRDNFKRIYQLKEEDEVKDDWVDRLNIVDRQIKFCRGGEMKQGRVVDVSRRGELIVAVDEESIKLRAGDIEIETEAGDEDDQDR